MKKKNFNLMPLLLVGYISLGTLSLQAQQEPDHSLSIGGSFLSRGELRHGGLPATDSKIERESKFITERTRLTLDFAQTGLAAKIVAQHAGIWGQTGQGSFNLHEAWAMLKTKNGLFAKAGRQELAYDDERIIGSNDWAMAASSHDVLKLGAEVSRHKLHLILAYNQNPENVNGGNFYTGGSQPYKTLQTAWYHYDFNHLPLGASLLFMNIGMQTGDEERPKTTYQRLYGTYLNFHPSMWKVELSYYIQRGKSGIISSQESSIPLASIPIEAWMGSAKVTFKPNDKYSIVAGYDYLSGDENFVTPGSGDIGLIKHEKIKGFSTVYGSHHQFYGAMDFFYVSAYVNGFTPGLQNFYAGGAWSPQKKLNFDASYHYLSTASSLRNAHKSLGSELELSASYSISKEAILMLGHSYMHGTKTMEVLKRTSENRSLHWGWVMLSISPSVFTTKW